MKFWRINSLALFLLLTLSLILAPKALAADRVTAQANNIDVRSTAGRSRQMRDLLRRLFNEQMTILRTYDIHE